MTMAEKPDKFPDWATEEEIDEVSGQSNFVEPPDFRKESGWTRREIPPRQWFNWLARKTGLWLRWVEDRLEGVQSELDDHIPQTGGIHGIPEGERALHTPDDGIPSNIVLIEESETYNPPSDVRAIMVYAVGAGGGGGNAASTGSDEAAYAGSGGGGATAIKLISPPVELSITVGAGGSPSSDGGDTLVTGTGVSLEAGGGNLGNSRDSSVSRGAGQGSSGGTGGTATGGDINAQGIGGQYGMMNGTETRGSIGSPGGSVLFGSHLNGVAQTASAGFEAGVNAEVYGAGGRGAGNGEDQPARDGGSGADGVVLIKEFK